MSRRTPDRKRRGVSPETQARAVAASTAATAGRSHRLHPTTSERAYSAEELDFLRAVMDYQGRIGSKFLTHCEYLHLLKSLGYLRTEAR